MPTPPLYLFEDSQTERLFPLTYSRPPSELRAGALTLGERLSRNLEIPLAGVFVRPGLAAVMRKRSGPAVNPTISGSEGLLLANARWFLAKSHGGFSMPAPDTAAVSQSSVVYLHLSPENAARINPARLHEASTLEAILPDVQRITSRATLLERPWQLLDYQRPAILDDFERLGAANEATVMPGAHLVAPERIHLSRGVKVWPGAVLDAQAGPIIVGENTEIRANAVITGPVAIGENCVIRTGADIREDSSFGPHSRVGGEISNCVFQGYASKQHHGFLGNSIVGEWANLGAGTTTSNLKNTYGNVRMPLAGKDEPTGRQFLGSVIGDHAKLAIGTYLSTGSVIGFGSHVLTSKPPRFVPSFSWVTEKGIGRADFEKLESVAGMVMERRGTEFTDADHELWVQIASEWSRTEQHAWVEE